MSRVDRRQGVKSGRPTVRDSKVSVVQLLELAEAGLTPDEISDRYCDIESPSHVIDALAWAASHPSEVSRLRERRNEARENLKDLSLNP